MILLGIAMDAPKIMARECDLPDIFSDGGLHGTAETELSYGLAWPQGAHIPSMSVVNQRGLVRMRYPWMRNCRGSFRR